MWSNKDQTGSCFPSYHSTSNGSIHDPSHLPDESIDIPSYPPESSGSIHSQPHLPVSSGSIYHPPASSGSSFRDRRGKPASTTKTQKRLGYASLVKPIPSGSSKIRGGSSRKSSVKQLSNEVDLPMFPDPSVLSGNANVYARSGKSHLYQSFILPDTSVGAKAGSDVVTDVILEPNGQDETDDDDEEEEERQKTSKTKPRSNGGPGGKKTKGKLKIKMEFIDDKVRRYTTFSKRKTGIMKKAYELSTLTGTQVMLLVASETGHVYTFATKKLQPIITSDAGKALIKTCLNSPDAVTAAAVPSSENRMSATGFEETEFTYSVPENEK